MFSLLRSIRRRWDEFKEKRAPGSRSVFVDGEGITQIDIVRGREIAELIRWKDVDSVFAYKRDCYTYDLICVAVVAKDLKTRIDVAEDDAGYQELVDSLPLNLKGCPAPIEWFVTVAFPAFETNITKLYGLS